jgi:hypothetical protein
MFNFVPIYVLAKYAEIKYHNMYNYGKIVFLIESKYDTSGPIQIVYHFFEACHDLCSPQMKSQPF